MRIGPIEITLTPASGRKTVKKIEVAEYADATLSSVLKDAGLKLDSMQINTADGVPIDPATLKLTGSVERSDVRLDKVERHYRFYATERASGS